MSKSISDLLQEVSRLKEMEARLGIIIMRQERKHKVMVILAHCYLITLIICIILYLVCKVG